MIDEKYIYHIDKDIAEGRDYVVYESSMDGFGNEESDIDIYIFNESTELTKDRNVTVKTIYKQKLDIENIDMKYIEKIFNILKESQDELDVFNLNWEDMKILHRIGKSTYYSLNNPTLKEIKKYLSNIDRCIAYFHFKESLAKYNDSVNFFKVKDISSAKLLIVESLISSLAAFLTTNNLVILNKKWVITGVREINNDYLIFIIEQIFTKPLNSIDYSDLINYSNKINKMYHYATEGR